MDESPDPDEGPGRTLPAGPVTGLAGLSVTLCLALFAGTLMPVALGALGPFVTTDLGLTPAQFGVLPSLVFLSGGVCSVLVSRFHRRFGSRTLMYALGVASAVGLAAIAAAPTYALLLPPTVLGGIAIALTNPVTNDVIRVQVPRERQGVVTGIKQSGNPLASLVSGAALPAIAVSAGWRTAIAATALAGAALIAMSRLTVAAVERRPRPATAGRAARDPIAAPLARVAFFLGGAVAAVGAYLPLYAFTDVGMSAAHAGLLTAGVGLTGLVARPVLGHLAQEVNPGTGLAWLGTGGVISGVLIIAASEVGPWAVIVAALLFGGSAVSWMVIAMLAVVRASHDATATSGVIQLWFYAGLTVMPLLFGWLVDVTGSFISGWLAVLVTMTVGTASALQARATFRRTD